VSFSVADFNTSNMLPEEEADEAFLDEEDDVETPQSGGANTKGAVNQGRTSAGNIKVAPEDSVAPADREELRNEEVSNSVCIVSGRSY
jgi:complement component 1 Q subcomponent-binding protein, mitochondrial